MMNEEFITRLGLIKDETENIIESYMPDLRGDYGIISEAMNYSFRSGGKRLRPIIIRETYSLFGGRNDAIVSPFAAAIEMIHTYSLIHDDLPAMDNDDLRRGRATNHKVYGEAMAILAGDGLLNYAFETASKAFDACEDISDYRNVSKAMKALSSFPGINGMIGGQVVDLLVTEGKLPGTERVFKEMDLLKTSALIECSFVIGASLAGASETDIDTMKEVGGLVGLAFQIRDDILDITGDEAKLGKSTGRDAKNGKQNFATMLGISRATDEVKRLSDEARTKLSKITSVRPGYSGFLNDLISYLTDREN